MNRQTVTPKEQAEFYKKRIQSIHGSLSLPKIVHVRGDRDLEMAKIHRKLSE